MKCAIMQPFFLPWSGYFNLMAQSDVFVFLDDVQFEKCSWQSRNRILVNKHEFWLTVPVQKMKLSTNIKDVLISDKVDWRNKFVRTLRQSYGKHPYGADIVDIVEMHLLRKDLSNLADLNIELTCAISGKLGIRTKCVRASAIACRGKRTGHVLAICEKMASTEYISPIGAKEYLEQDGFQEMTDIKLTFQQFSPGRYQQYRSDDFVSHLSIVDVVANLGWHGAQKYITDVMGGGE